MRVLGIDPGLHRTGYACVTCARGGEPVLAEAGVVRLRTADAVATRLVELEADLRGIIERFEPRLVCVEALFAHYAHPATAITMGHARGVILCTAARAGLRIAEFKPNAVKKFVTGNGHASKDQVQVAVRALLGLDAAPSPADVADAIAIALCGAHRHPEPETGVPA